MLGQWLSFPHTPRELLILILFIALIVLVFWIWATLKALWRTNKFVKEAIVEIADIEREIECQKIAKVSRRDEFRAFTEQLKRQFGILKGNYYQALERAQNNNKTIQQRICENDKLITEIKADISRFRETLPSLDLEISTARKRLRKLPRRLYTIP